MSALRKLASILGARDHRAAGAFVCPVPVGRVEDRAVGPDLVVLRMVSTGFAAGRVDGACESEWLANSLAQECPERRTSGLRSDHPGHFVADVRIVEFAPRLPEKRKRTNEPRRQTGGRMVSRLTVESFKSAQHLRTQDRVFDFPNEWQRIIERVLVDHPARVAEELAHRDPAAVRQGPRQPPLDGLAKTHPSFPRPAQGSTWRPTSSSGCRGASVHPARSLRRSSRRPDPRLPTSCRAGPKANAVTPGATRPRPCTSESMIRCRSGREPWVRPENAVRPTTTATTPIEITAAPTTSRLARPPTRSPKSARIDTDRHLGNALWYPRRDMSSAKPTSRCSVRSRTVVRGNAQASGDSALPRRHALTVRASLASNKANAHRRSRRESSINGSIRALRPSARLNTYEKAPTCGAFAEPSDGLEPSTPSLPWRIRASAYGASEPALASGVSLHRG